MEVSNLYFEALMGFKLKGIMHDPPLNIHRSSNIKFEERPTFHKVARVVYKIIRALYVSLIFYFVPFLVIFTQFFMKYDKNSEHGESGHGHH